MADSRSRILMQIEPAVAGRAFPRKSKYRNYIITF